MRNMGDLVKKILDMGLNIPTSTVRRRIGSNLMRKVRMVKNIEAIRSIRRILGHLGAILTLQSRNRSPDSPDNKPTNSNNDTTRNSTKTATVLEEKLKALQ